jgi:hypothetical protein
LLWLIPVRMPAEIASGEKEWPRHRWSVPRLLLRTGPRTIRFGDAS